MHRIAPLLVVLLTSCRFGGDDRPLGPPQTLLDVPISQPPYERVHVNWKHRLDQPYLYVEHRGDYRAIGLAIQRLEALVAEAGVARSGPLFCLYYDDPGNTALGDLRSRACVPVGGPYGEGAELRYDVLPSVTVVYAVVAGPAQDAPRAYPALFEFLSSRGWVEDGPLRHVYLNVERITAPSELLTEVQLPWSSG